MTSILNLSRFIVVPILTEWISWIELSRLDTSCCNKKSRQVLMQFYLQYPNAFRKYFERQTVYLNSISVEWFKSRGLTNCLDDVCIANRYMQSISANVLIELLRNIRTAR